LLPGPFAFAVTATTAPNPCRSRHCSSHAAMLLLCAFCACTSSARTLRLLFSSEMMKPGVYALEVRGVVTPEIDEFLKQKGIPYRVKAPGAM